MLDPKHIHQHKTKISKADISNITVAALARCLRFVHNLTKTQCQMVCTMRFQRVSKILTPRRMIQKT